MFLLRTPGRAAVFHQYIKEFHDVRPDHWSR